MQDLGVHGQHGATTLPPSELEPSEHSRKAKQDWRPPAVTTGARISALCASASCAGDRQSSPVSPWPRCRRSVATAADGP